MESQFGKAIPSASGTKPVTNIQLLSIQTLSHESRVFAKVYDNVWLPASAKITRKQRRRAT